MKTVLFSFLLTTILLLAGCADTSISPIESDSQSYQLIKLPPKSGLSVENIFSQTKLINGKIGGLIKIQERYVAANGNTVKIDAKLKVPNNAFVGNVNITITIDDEYAAVSFSPEMVFDKPLRLDLKFTGIDLEELNLTSGNYDFVYIDDDGNTEMIQYDGIEVDELKGEIRVQKAYLNHFSRYCFTR
ncbi:MAG: hypothetical protein BMS9Abin39_1087 [Ignavibacteria bacterium]|nr:MAG: hypothetical protein BMS9Abin39_1087 [Ignavibacteria bacterium]